MKKVIMISVNVSYLDSIPQIVWKVVNDVFGGACSGPKYWGLLPQAQAPHDIGPANVHNWPHDWLLSQVHRLQVSLPITN